MLINAINEEWVYWHAFCEFGDISFATGKHAFEGSSAPASSIQPAATLSDEPSIIPNTPPPFPSPLSSKTDRIAAASLTAMAVHNISKVINNNNGMNIDDDEDFPDRVATISQPTSSSIAHPHHKSGHLLFVACMATQQSLECVISLIFNILPTSPDH